MAVLDRYPEVLSVGERIYNYVELYRRANGLTVRAVIDQIRQAGASYMHSPTRALTRSIDVHTLQCICSVLNVQPYDIIPDLYPLQIEDLEVSEVQVRYNLARWALTRQRSLLADSLPEFSHRPIYVTKLCQVADTYQVEMSVLCRHVPNTTLNRYIDHKEM